MPIDVEAARAVTPGVDHVTHLNNAGAALPPQVVVDTVIEHLRREAVMGGYEAEDAQADQLDGVYRSVGRLLGAAPDEIALVESATIAWNAAFTALQFSPGDRILTGRTEYVSNAINLLAARDRYGAEIVLIDDDEHGQISLDQLRSAIDERAKLIALTHVPTNGGVVNPAAEVGRIARDAGVPYLLDACQSVGQMQIDIAEVGCDMLSATGRKFLRAPRGTGFLYVGNHIVERLVPAQLDMRSANWTAPDRYEIMSSARRFEVWESSIANRLGLGAAIEHALDWGLDQIEARTFMLAEHLRLLLATVPRVRVRDKGVTKCGIVTFDVEGMAAPDVQRLLTASRINTTITSAAVARFDLPHRGLDQLVRASPHYYNTDDELARLVEVVASLP